MVTLYIYLVERRRKMRKIRSLSQCSTITRAKNCIVIARLSSSTLARVVIKKIFKGHSDSHFAQVKYKWTKTLQRFSNFFTNPVRPVNPDKKKGCRRRASELASALIFAKRREATLAHDAMLQSVLNKRATKSSLLMGSV